MSTAYRPPKARRLNSGAWSRLKPSAVDSLENVGLPSKGETKLYDLKAQETYYQKIVDRWLKFCADAGTTTELDRQFAAISLVSNPPSQPAKPAKPADNLPAPSTTSDPKANPTSSTSPHLATATPFPTAPSPELSTILMAMRKLREAIVGTSRTDAFAQKAYIFVIRATILLKHWESYVPALLYLLSRIHPRTPLSAPDLHEFVGYYILDLCCRQSNYHDAYRIKHEYSYSDRKIDRVISALVHDDWVTFWKVRGKVDGYMVALMGFAEGRVREVALKCLARSYFTAEKGFVERSAGMAWEVLVRECGVGWELEGERVTIRRAKGR